MATATRLLSTLRTFHLDRPDATREQLWERLRVIAEGVFETRTDWNHHGGIGLNYSDIREDLKDIVLTEPLNAAQAEAIPLAHRVMWAAERRAEGDFGPLLEILEELKQGITTVSEVPIASVTTAPGPDDALTFEKLSALHMAERMADWQPNTLKNKRSCYGVLVGLLGELDLRTHIRKDMTDLKARLMSGDRKPSTVNKILMELSAVMTWAEDNGYVDKSYDKGLQLRKGLESEREAFATEQVVTLMDHANRLPVTSWQRWAVSLGVVTGARIGELHQLTTADLVRDAEGQLTVVDINTNGGKTLKNKFSARVVPVVGAYGLDVEALKEFAESADGRLFKMSSSGFTAMLNQLLRDVLGTEAGTGQSFHSLRHHLAGALKAAEVPLGTAQEILGHSSGSITFDLYGSGRAVQIGRMAEALRIALSAD